MNGDAACMGACEAEKGSEGAAGGLFDYGKGGGGVVDMEVCIEDGEDEVGCYARGIGGSVEFGHEALIPCIDGVLEDFFGELEEAIFAQSGFGDLGVQKLGELLRFMIFDQGSTWAASFLC